LKEYTMALMNGAKAPKRMGIRMALGAGFLSLAALAGGAGVASAATSTTHARTTTYEVQSKRDSRDRGSEQASKDKSTDAKDGYADGSGDPQSPDTNPPTDG
jgi:hypothetical protein